MLGLLTSTLLIPQGVEPEIQFARDVQPILSENCFQCHGPDASARQAKLRLDTKDGAFAAREGGAAVVPGDVAASLIVRRITAADAADRMPPAKTGKHLAQLIQDDKARIVTTVIDKFELALLAVIAVYLATWAYGLWSLKGYLASRRKPENP